MSLAVQRLPLAVGVEAALADRPRMRFSESLLYVLIPGPTEPRPPWFFSPKGMLRQCHPSDVLNSSNQNLPRLVAHHCLLLHPANRRRQGTAHSLVDTWLQRYRHHRCVIFVTEG